MQRLLHSLCTSKSAARIPEHYADRDRKNVAETPQIAGMLSEKSPHARNLPEGEPAWRSVRTLALQEHWRSCCCQRQSLLFSIADAHTAYGFARVLHFDRRAKFEATRLLPAQIVQLFRSTLQRDRYTGTVYRIIVRRDTTLVRNLAVDSTTADRTITARETWTPIERLIDSRKSLIGTVDLKISKTIDAALYLSQLFAIRAVN